MHSAVGDGVTMWQAGDRVGVGWSGGSDLTCEFCRRGDFTNCVNRTITGANFDGGYAEYMVAPQDVAAITAFLASDDAGLITGQQIIADGGMH